MSKSSGTKIILLLSLTEGKLTHTLDINIEIKIRKTAKIVKTCFTWDAGVFPKVILLK